jgi:hypothetical protein
VGGAPLSGTKRDSADAPVLNSSMGNPPLSRQGRTSYPESAKVVRESIAGDMLLEVENDVIVSTIAPTDSRTESISLDNDIY